jgi:acyl-CoA reductase-like NAD-dependent aldehyde dehydrogenase
MLLSANIVFADSNIDAAVSGLLAGVFAASGQSCVAGSRALIQRSVADEVLSKLVARTKEILMGDPKDPATQMGPIAFPGHLDRITGFMKRALDDGAEVLAGGEVDPARPQFFPPTIVRGLAVDSAVCQEEIFGPILSVIEFEDEDEAVRIANATKYGLAAGVWTRDIQRGMRMARRLVAGTVWLNAYRTLGYAMPFGGLRESGYGRDNGIESMSEYLTDKAVWIETTGAIRDPFTVG